MADMWLWIDGPELAWVDDTQQLTDDVIDAMAAWQFWWNDERNLVMLTDEDE